MKKYVVFIIFIFIIIFSYIWYTNRAHPYVLEYTIGDYKIKEEYRTDSLNFYQFEVKKEDVTYHFVSSHSYTKDRYLIKKVLEEQKEKNVCLSLNLFKENTPFLCYDGKNYSDAYIAELIDLEEPKKKNTVANTEIYDDTYTYLLWDGYGLNDITNKREYHFLKKESYDNPLSYQYQNLMLIADLDSSREFSKFYLYNHKKGETEEWEFDGKISHNSYFMGSVGNYIYLFDMKNKTQYRLNAKKKALKITSDKEGALFYENDVLSTKALNQLQYKPVLFLFSKLYQYKVIDNHLYLTYPNSEQKIKVSNKEITSIIKEDNDTIFYLSKETLYMYSPKTGEKQLLKNFEWNFSYQNKIYIFN